MKKTLLGYETVAASVTECNADIVTALETADGRCRWLACLNPHSYAVAKKDTAFSQALRCADWLVPDGIGILIAGRVLNLQLKERITGFDIFEGVMRELNARGGSVFFLGSTDDNLARIAEKLPRDYPNIHLAGTYSPPFKSEFSKKENDHMLEQINQAAPDVLWVGMTAPKQEKWIAAMQPFLQVRFAGAIGAVFDFYTGKVKRSHPIFQCIGLEWLPRLLRQPRRLWRRIAISAPIFLWDVSKSRLAARKVD